MCDPLVEWGAGRLCRPHAIAEGDGNPPRVPLSAI